MTFDITASMDAIESFAAASGHFNHVQRGEPKSAPGPGLTCAVGMRSMDVAETTLTHTVEVHTVEMLIYWNELGEPAADGESALAAVAEAVLGQICGDFDLGATIRAVDVGGAHSAGVSADWGYSEVSGTWFRVVRLTLPLIVDDSVATVA